MRGNVRGRDVGPSRGGSGLDLREGGNARSQFKPVLPEFRRTALCDPRKHPEGRRAATKKKDRNVRKLSSGPYLVSRTGAVG